MDGLHSHRIDPVPAIIFFAALFLSVIMIWLY
jgi:hypothetical protein